MKWLIGALAAFSIFGSAYAQSRTLEFSIQKVSGNTCSWYRGSFDQYGWQTSKTDGANTLVWCRLVDNVGAQCIVRNHGLDSPAPAVITMRGTFQSVGDDIMIVNVGYDNLNARVVCERGQGCHRFMLWDITDAYGFACETVKFTPAPPPPKKPVPLPPPLLRKPNASNTPAAPIELEKDWTL